MQCAVTATGEMDACKILTESPPGQGFGAAALRLARKFRAPSKTASGQSIEGATVTIPIRFHIYN